MRTKNRHIRVPGGRTLQVTPVFDSYWRFAFERQEVFHKRVARCQPPWTDDKIIANHRFTNVYRASDRVSQYLIRNVLYSGDQAEEEVFFRAMLFKLFNRVETWEYLKERLGDISWRSYSFARYAKVLDARFANGRVYSGAYIMPSPRLGYERKHRNHLKLLEHMIKGGLPSRICASSSLSQVYSLLLSQPSLGPFLAFQFAIDLNYSKMINYSEMDFVVAGPGAKDGIRKCFSSTGGLGLEDTIRAVADLGEAEFARQGLRFKDLWGRRPQLIDCQNVFCEVDKYARVAHPEYTGISGRERIKQSFSPFDREVPQWYPPKWGVKPKRHAFLGATTGARQCSPQAL